MGEGDVEQQQVVQLCHAWWSRSLTAVTRLPRHHLSHAGRRRCCNADLWSALRRFKGNSFARLGEEKELLHLRHCSRSLLLCVPGCYDLLERETDAPPPPPPPPPPPTTDLLVFSVCAPCLVLGQPEDAVNDTTKTVYYAIAAGLFNVGWACVQVSHMALVPELTEVQSTRVILNSAR